MEPVVEVDGLVKRYGARTAVDGLSFKVERGSITAVLGPNGAGKTTTVECCEGYRRPDAGSVRVLGLDPQRQGAHLRPRIGIMLQNGGIYSGVRADEMLRHMARLYAHPLDVSMLIERLGLGSAGRTPYRRLSGGQQQRLSLAMAMVGRPELVFLDEPTAGLDPQARRAAWELLEEVRRDGVTVVLTTHLMDEAERLSDRVVIIDNGRVVTSGTPAELTAGGARVVRFDGPAGLDRAALRAVLPGPVRVEEDGPGRYTIEGEIRPELLAALTAWCAEQGVMPEGLRVGRRTLEEVFLELTGRWLRE
jgi:ABC-2 type transport system ATP-binding protein